MSNSENVLVDTDAGVDDILALFVLMQIAPPSAVDIVVTFGNVSLSQALSNVILFGSVSGLMPRAIWRGSAAPLLEKPNYATEVHGNDGLGGITNLPSWQPPSTGPDVRPFANAKIEHYEKIIVLGPLTNIAWLEQMSAASMPLFVMGGAFNVAGNVSSSAEFNFHSDPEAAKSVFEHYAGDIFVVPLDVCNTVTLTRAFLREVCGKNPGRTQTFINLIHQQYMDFYQSVEGIDGCHPHDTLAVCAAFIPGLFHWIRGHVRVIGNGPERGRSLLEPSSTGRHHVAQSVDAAGFFRLLETAIINFNALSSTKR